MSDKLYSQAERERINNKLLSLGVYREAQGTTLPLNGREDLRELITSGKQEQHKVILFYPASSKINFNNNVALCDLLYQLYVKENYLQHPCIFNASLHNLYHAMNEHKTFIEDSIMFPGEETKYQSNVTLCIEDFYQDRECVMTKSDYKEQDTIERYLKYRMYSKKSLLILQSEKHPDSYNNFWSKKFSSMLSNTAKIIRVTAN